MPCIRSRQLDARRSNFSTVTRDQNNFFRPTTVNNFNFTIAGYTPEQTVDIIRRLPLATRSSTASESTPLTRGIFDWCTSSPIDIAVRLIVEITHVLDRTAFSTDYRILKLELEVLRQTLLLTGRAIRAYEYTPLGQNLSSTTGSEVEQCCVILEELLNAISGNKQGLIATIIGRFWKVMGWNGNDMDPFVLKRLKLWNSQMSLGSVLMALNS